MIFSAELCSKNAGKSTFVLWGTAHEEYLKNSNIPQPNQNSAALWRIFSTNKSAPANGKKGFYTNRDPNKQGVGLIFDFCMQWYHSHADPVLPDGILKITLPYKRNVQNCVAV
jgi:hypothetical protein